MAIANTKAPCSLAPTSPNLADTTPISSHAQQPSIALSDSNRSNTWCVIQLLRKWSLPAIMIIIFYGLCHKYIPTRRDVNFAPKSNYGLVLADTLNSHTTGPGVDIFFVHGLGSNPDTTWLGYNQSYAHASGDGAFDDPYGLSAGKKDVNWITDFLQDDLPPHLRKSTRIFFYNYDSYWMRDSVEERRARLGQELFEQIAEVVTKDPDRMSIFVGHSYGGLVIKEALLSAFAYQKHRPVNVFQRVRAVTFMGTPHRGSDESKFGVIIALVLKYLGFHSNADILFAAKYDSPELRDMHRRFEAISQHVMVVNFYETLKLSNLWGLYRTYAVEEASATLDRPGWQNLALHTDHTGLNKFWKKDYNYQKVSRKLISLVETIIRGEHDATSVHVVPPRLRKEYIERQELSDQIQRNLKESGSIVAVVGIGGMGKTQLALRYAEIHKGRYNIVLWIDATSKETILLSFHQCAKTLNGLLNFPSISNSPDPETVRLVLQWLQKRGDRYGETLLIFDNVDEFSTTIVDLIPSNLHGSIIITTRNVQCLVMLPHGTHRVNVADMTPFEAQSLLLRYLGLNTIGLPEAIQKLSHRICQALHWSPLAIHLAGTQLRLESINEYTDISITEGLLNKFLKDIQLHEDDIFKAETIKGLSSYDLTLYTVLDSSLSAIDNNFPNTHSRQFLEFIASTPITTYPISLFESVAKDLTALRDGVDLGLPIEVNEWQNEFLPLVPSWVKDLFLVDNERAWDDFKFRQVLQPLLRYGLIEYSRNQELVQIFVHPLVRWKANQDSGLGTNNRPHLDVVNVGNGVIKLVLEVIPPAGKYQSVCGESAILTLRVAIKIGDYGGISTDSCHNPNLADSEFSNGHSYEGLCPVNGCNRCCV